MLHSTPLEVPVPPLLVLICGAVLIGLVPAGVRLSAELGQLGPLATALWRFLLACPVLLVLALSRGGGGPAQPLLLAVAGLAFAADIACFFVSIARCGGAVATLLSNCAPLAVLALAPWLLRQATRAVAWWGALVAILGLIALVQPQRGSPDTLGTTMGLVSAAFYGVYQLALVGLGPAVSPWWILSSASVSGSLVLGLCCLISGERLLPAGAAGWAVLIGLAGVTQIGGQGLIAWSLPRLPAALGSLVLLVQPLVAALVGWLVFAETLGPVQITGAVILLAGLWWVRRSLTTPIPVAPSIAPGGHAS